jgi:hypothetical protein
MIRTLKLENKNFIISPYPWLGITTPKSSKGLALALKTKRKIMSRHSRTEPPQAELEFMELQMSFWGKLSPPILVPQIAKDTVFAPICQPLIFNHALKSGRLISFKGDFSHFGINIKIMALYLR